jgi:hypothetical protein
MFAQWPNWVSRSPSVRRALIRLWRAFLRVQRATLANAVLVVREGDGRVLAIPSPSGRLRLPDIQLDAWIPIPTQVEGLLIQLTRERSTPALVAVDGTPGKEGVSFLYAATIDSSPAKSSHEIWLDADDAARSLGSRDKRLIQISEAMRNNQSRISRQEERRR